MKKLFIAGNWKSNKQVADANTWFDSFEKLNIATPITKGNHTIVLCPGYLLLPLAAEQIRKSNLPLELGAQDVSLFGEGAFTGAVNAKQIVEFAPWVIVGHSERRKFFGENDEMLAQKIHRAKEAGLKIIYCVPDEKTGIPTGVDVVAYEPVWAIGTGKTDTPENANAVIETIKKRIQARVIYGGSVTEENVLSFVAKPAIDGVLPGGASMDPDKFFQMVQRMMSSA